MSFQKGNNEVQKRKRTRILLKIDLKMIADAKGVSKRTVRRAINTGKVDTNSLSSIINYICE